MKISETKIGHVQAIIIVICAAVFIVAAYYIMSAVYGEGGYLAPPHPDSLIYMQYAKSMAEGHPYEFIPGQGRSTGSTSHLYPLLLSILYKFGARGSMLFNAGFMLNGVFYILFILFCWIAAKKIMPSEASLAIVLILFNGYLSSTAMGMSDMGLFMMVSMGTFAAAVSGSAVLTGVGLALCACSRPEGLVFSVALIAVGAVMCAFREKKGWQFTTAGVVGLVAALSVFALNRALTGVWQFHSTVNKALFANYPFWGAITHTVRDFSRMIREVLFNLSSNARQAYFLPVVGGMLAIVGIASIDWKSGKTKYQEAWWLLTALGGLGLVAISGWQFLVMDRYLGWILPVLYLYAASGAHRISSVFSSRPAGFRLLAGLLIGYEIVTLPLFLTMYGSSCMFTQSRVNFYRSIDQQLAPNKSLGALSGTGLVYIMPRRHMVHVSGITTPALSGARHTFCNIEELKHHPEFRFDNWLITVSQKTSALASCLLGADVAGDFDAMGNPNALVLCLADWDTVSGVSATPLLPRILEFVEEMTCVQRLDVGYTEDEEHCDYSVETRVPQTKMSPFVTTRPLGDRIVTEVGQAVIGSDSFTVRVTPGKPLKIVMRTTLTADGPVARVDMMLSSQKIIFKSPIRLKPVVNGNAMPDVELDLGLEEDQLTEVIIDIPAELVDSDTLNITLDGDHIALAYWFYQ